MQKALAPDITTWPDEQPQLIGSPVRGLRRHGVPRPRPAARSAAPQA